MSRNRLFSVILLLLLVIQQLPVAMACQTNAHGEMNHANMMQDMAKMDHSAHGMTMEQPDCCDDDCNCPVGSCSQALLLVDGLQVQQTMAVATDVIAHSTNPPRFSPNSLYRPPALS